MLVGRFSMTTHVLLKGKKTWVSYLRNGYINAWWKLHVVCTTRDSLEARWKLLQNEWALLVPSGRRGGGVVIIMNPPKTQSFITEEWFTLSRQRECFRSGLSMCVIDAEIASEVQRFGNSRSQQFDVGACVTVSIIDRLFYIPQFQGVKSPSRFFFFFIILFVRNA